MRFDPAQLETLVAITEEGTFEAAARRLHLTPSAVSQRIRALEHAAGTVIVQRTTPAQVTPAGEPLLRLGRQLRLLVDEASSDLDDGGVVELPVVVNADSLATWFRDVLVAVAAEEGIALRLHVEDQAYSHDHLRRGDVLAAVTDNPDPVQGCVAQPLGLLRYSASVSADLLDRHRNGRSVDRASLPMVMFNEKDHLQDEVLAALGAERPRVVHRVPSTADFYAAIRCGLGWGMLPDLQSADALASGELVRLPGAKPVDVPLYWQRWRLESPALAGLTAHVERAAKKLRRPRLT